MISHMDFASGDPGEMKRICRMPDNKCLMFSKVGQFGRITILPISKLPLEGGFHGTYSFGLGDISASYFSGYDRVFNFTGVNVYSNNSQTIFSPPDLVFGYRKTNVLGFGFTFLNPSFN